MIKIYHNPRCSKSRLGVAYLEDKNAEFEIIKYLDNPFTIDELTNVLSKLNIAPIEVIRKNEAIWKSDFKSKTLSDAELIEAMVKNPKLIERPIVVNGSKAVVARPTERIDEIL
ncbi:arsenate reductase (glutaredoxin) [Aurantibacter aestuarii]|uniref:Arsenate reductase (Glutaredoxin) n=1 Tax=Aurantibacter aestuarii TaxID=1266046 RepID=A0A2T1N993_9FLAO|nr:arsenate reductase (glutaredoxin) [Aurantibacter aestuarii]PSG88429.1 arsenate reductase (glutaredoxin) [Aurantibacter aestuarii]